MARIADHCTFAYVKAHVAEVAALGGAFWDGCADSFINKGTKGRWRAMLTERDVADYNLRARAELGPKSADWLALGSHAKAVSA